MRASLFFFAVLLLAPLVAGMTDACWDAYEGCDWDFMDMGPGLKKFALVEPDVPLTPQVISKNENITLGVLNSNGITQEFILRNGEARNITRFGKPRLSPDHFKPFIIPQVMGSAVGFHVMTGSQPRAMKRRCVRVFFTNYQKFMGGNPPMVENLVATKLDRKCVVFITK